MVSKHDSVRIRHTYRQQSIEMLPDNNSQTTLTGFEFCDFVGCIFQMIHFRRLNVKPSTPIIEHVFIDISTTDKQLLCNKGKNLVGLENIYQKKPTE